MTFDVNSDLPRQAQREKSLLLRQDVRPAEGDGFLKAL